MAAVLNACTNNIKKPAEKQAFPAPLSIPVSLKETVGKKQLVLGEHRFVPGKTDEEKRAGIVMQQEPCFWDTVGCRVKEVRKTLKGTGEEVKLVNRLHLFRQVGKQGSQNGPW